jgi:hypothetical protein
VIEDFQLEQLDPRAKLLIVCNLHTGELGFISGEKLRAKWEHKDLRRYEYNVALPPASNPAAPWVRCITPDGRCHIIKFLSLDYQLLDESALSELENQEQKEPKMGTKKTVEAKIAKTEAKAAKAATPPPAPTKSTPAAKPSKAAPVKPAAVAKPGKAKTPGEPYMWGIVRLRGNVVSKLTADETRAQTREDMKALNTYKEIKAYVLKAGITDEQFEDFLEVFFAECRNH